MIHGIVNGNKNGALSWIFNPARVREIPLASFDYEKRRLTKVKKGLHVGY